MGVSGSRQGRKCAKIRLDEAKGRGKAPTSILFRKARILT